MCWKRARVRVVRRRRTRQQRQDDDDEQKKQHAYVPSAALSAFAVASAAVERPTQPPSATSGEVPARFNRYFEKMSDPVEQGEPNSSGATGDCIHVSVDGDGEKKNNVEDNGVVAHGSTTFSSQPFASFQVSFAVEGETHMKIMVVNLKTDEQCYVEELKRVFVWDDDDANYTRESSPMELSEFVTIENRIPMATLGNYVKCFNDIMKAPRADRVPRPDLVSLVTATTDRNGVRLEITLQVRVLSHQWLAKYEFLLLGAEKKPEKQEPEPEQADGAIEVIQKQLQAQAIEIANLKKQVMALQMKKENSTESVQEKKEWRGVYFRATAFSTAERDEEIDWVAQRTCEGYFKVKEDAMAINNAIEFVKPGSFAVLVLAHHSNCENDTPAFQLLINGKCEQSCFASSSNGSWQSSSLMHFVHARAGDKLSVVYKGSGSCKAESCLEVNLVE